MAAAERGTTGPEHSLVDPGAIYVPAAHSIRSERVSQQDDNTTLLRDAELPRARHGPIEVVLVSAALQRAAGPSRLTARLVVAVRVRNASPTATLLYRPWSGGDAAPYALPVRLHDDEGRDYPLRGIDFGREAPGLGAELRPGDAATDVLAFQLPGETFASLDLELPPENVGGKGPFPLRLHIPAAAVCR
jgi:hypothetical protein